MMQVSGTPRTLNFTAGRSSLLLHAPADWGGLPLEVHRLEGRDEAVEAGPLDGERGLMVYLSGSMDYFFQVGGEERKVTSSAGNAILMAGAQRMHIARMAGQANVAVVHLPASWFPRALCDRVPPEFNRTIPLGTDPTIAALTQTLCDEAIRGAPTGPLFAESVSLALVHYMVGRVVENRQLGEPRGLTREQRAALVRFIDENLNSELALPRLAGVVGLKPRHFLTVFSRCFGATPYRYVVGRRLEAAARRLACNAGSIAEIAYDVGYSSQSHFTAAFRRAYGETPRKYAQRHRVH